jgi:hypothetical protein
MRSLFGRGLSFSTLGDKIATAFVTDITVCLTKEEVRWLEDANGRVEDVKKDGEF